MNWELAAPALVLGTFAVVWSVCVERLAFQHFRKHGLARIAQQYAIAYEIPDEVASAESREREELELEPKSVQGMQDFATATAGLAATFSWYTDLAQLVAVASSSGIGLFLIGQSSAAMWVALTLCVGSVIWFTTLIYDPEPELHGREWRSETNRFARFRSHVSLVTAVAFVANTAVVTILLLQPSVSPQSPEILDSAGAMPHLQHVT